MNAAPVTTAVLTVCGEKLLSSSKIGQTFDAAGWLLAFTAIGGGYALMSGRKLAFLVDECDAEDLTSVMAQIVGQPDRQEAIKRAIECRSFGVVP